MKIELQSKDGLPDHIAGLIEEADGKAMLDLTRLAPADELEKFKSKTQTAQQEAIDRRKALQAWEGLGFASPDEVKAKLAQGADPAIVQQLQAKIAETESKYAQKLTGLVKSRTMADTKAELAKVGVVPEFLDLVAKAAEDMIQIDEEGSVRIIKDGKPMIGSGSDGGATLADLAKELAKAYPRAIADTGTGGGGKPPQSGGKPTGSTVTRAQWDAMSHGDRATFSKAGGKVTN